MAMEHIRDEAILVFLNVHMDRPNEQQSLAYEKREMEDLQALLKPE
jgi:hypothetical protein